MTSSWFALSTLNYDARSTAHHIYKLRLGVKVATSIDTCLPEIYLCSLSSFRYFCYMGLKLQFTLIVLITLTTQSSSVTQIRTTKHFQASTESPPALCLYRFSSRAPSGSCSAPEICMKSIAVEKEKNTKG